MHCKGQSNNHVLGDCPRSLARTGYNCRTPLHGRYCLPGCQSMFQWSYRLVNQESRVDIYQSFLCVLCWSSAGRTTHTREAVTGTGSNRRITNTHHRHGTSQHTATTTAEEQSRRHTEIKRLSKKMDIDRNRTIANISRLYGRSGVCTSERNKSWTRTHRKMCGRIFVLLLTLSAQSECVDASPNRTKSTDRVVTIGELYIHSDGFFFIFSYRTFACSLSD